MVLYDSLCVKKISESKMMIKNDVEKFFLLKYGRIRVRNEKN